MASDLKVLDWPTPSTAGDQPSSAFVDDPVVGRQLCPPLTRLNLVEKKNEGVLLSEVKDASETGKKNSIWRLELRKDLYWWSGAAVTVEDLREHLLRNLELYLKNKYANVFTVPSFTVEKISPSAVEVRWKNNPKFEPFALNGATLWRPRKGSKDQDRFRFECAGLYAAKSGGSHKVVLELNQSYKANTSFKNVELSSTLDVDKEGDERKTPELVFGGALSNIKRTECKNSLELPTMTVVAWNTKKGPTADPKFRTALTLATPRGAILREGSDGLGELLSGPVLRGHPAFATQGLLKPFDPSEAEKAFEHLGYKRAKIDAPRLNNVGEALKLKIGVAQETAGVVEKVIGDGLLSLGIRAEFVRTPESSKNRNDSDLSGLLQSVRAPWPDLDLLRFFHAKAIGDEVFGAVADAKLDAALEAYALDLSKPIPDLSKLQAVQKRLAELEPMTVIMQHRACINGEPKLADMLKKVDIRDPDWFRRILL